ncbi:MAG: RNA 2'-phosphotransferase [Kangiellaceae bacterium]|nr:RNA 2'-phosphotransferase [Kangiellaceae bacterium]
MKEQTKRISKLMSYVLRHNPSELDLDMDEQGWVLIEQLISNARAKGKKISIDIVKTAVETNDKKRFMISEDGRYIRANQGHSINVDLDLKPVEPPEELLHGTATKNLDVIMRDGLKKMNRHHVHLSEDRNTATAVGTRYGKPVLLRIDTRQMVEDGFEFYLSDNNVWLVDSVPAKYISFE